MQFFSAGTDKDLLCEFERYIQDKIYNLQVVDIILQVLANALGLTLVVADVIGNTKVIETRYSCLETDDQLFLLRNCDHFDGLVKRGDSDTKSKCESTNLAWSDDDEGNEDDDVDAVMCEEDEKTGVLMVISDEDGDKKDEADRCCPIGRSR